MVVRTLIRFIVTAVIVTAISLVTTYFILKNNIETQITQLDKASRLIASQVSSANLNSILGFTNDYFIFIIHKRDGRILFESGKRPAEESPLWEQSKFIIFKQMMEQPEGTLRYPDVETWNVLSIRKIIRYISIPDLEWVLAVELPASVTLSQLAGIYTPVVAGGILLASVLITSCFYIGNGKRQVRPAAAVDSPSETLAPPVTPVVEAAPEVAAAPKPDYAYQKRLIAEARKQLETGKSKPAENKETIEAPQMKMTEKPSPIERPAEQAKIAEPPQPLETAKIEESPKTETPKAAEPVKATEVYFDKLLEQKKGKLQPNSIIGMALSKKLNREKLDT